MSKQTVLLADDDRTTRSIITSILKTKGYVVETADRGEKCLFLALENTYDAILVDINMPGLSGIDLCRKLRGIDRYKMSPIIVVTTLQEEFILTEAFSAGASDYVSKPVNPTVLTERLNSHLEKKRYYDELESAKNYMNRYVSVRTQRMVEAYSSTGFVASPELHDVSVMFTDIRGFTRLSHSINLEDLFFMVSKELGKQIKLVNDHNGYIDKFGGDGLMAIFEGADSVENACICSWKIIHAFQQDPLIEKHGQMPIGIGIHYGSVIMGNIGSEEHLDYSALGETVNLASRLCAHSESNQISVSSTATQKLNETQNFVFSAPEEVDIKGFDKPVLVHTLDSIKKLNEWNGS